MQQPTERPLKSIAIQLRIYTNQTGRHKKLQVAGNKSNLIRVDITKSDLEMSYTYMRECIGLNTSEQKYTVENCLPV